MDPDESISGPRSDPDDALQSFDEAGQRDMVDTTLPGDDEATETTPVETALQRGATIGRYTVLEKIGSGGMGVVYGAFDPQLDRKVALKVMHPGSSGSAGSMGGRQRLLREAQAMAKLSHPNVITVHDVGTFGDRVFVAMEFIEGSTLREWIDMIGREWPEIVDAFVRAGRGLASAHAAGLVHRDFKPDNVLMGVDGRVLVMDFGLARQAAARTAPIDPDASTQTGLELPREDLILTRTGALLGTPAYMAPEQHTGGQLGPAADQFSFCVALWEALYGERPFAGNSVTSLAMNVLDGQLRPPPRTSRVPTWLRDVLARGLSVDPTDRFPSMDALLAELQRDPPKTRNPWLAGGVAVVVASGIVVAYFASRPPPDAGCEKAAAEASEIWNDERREQVHAAIGSGVVDGETLAYAETTWQSVESLVDDYVEHWADASVEVCVTERRRQQARRTESAPGSECMHARLVELDALLTAYADAPTAVVVQQAVAAAQNLRPPRVCVGIDTLTAELPPPSTDARSKLDSVNAELAIARALQQTGRPRAALEHAIPLVTTTTALNAPGLEARILVLLARAQAQVGELGAAERSLRRAILSAAAAGRDDVEAEAWVAMVEVVGNVDGDSENGRRMALAAESAIARAGDRPRLRAALAMSLGAMDQADGSYEEALDHFERALEIRRERLDPEHLDIAAAREGIGIALEALGRPEAAMDQQSAALAMREQTLGAQHPSVARSLSHLATAMQAAQRSGAAEASLVRARMILDPGARVSVDEAPTSSADSPEPAPEVEPGRHDRELALVLDRMGLLLRDQRKPQEAVRWHVRAIALLEHAVGPDDVDVAYPAANLGLALADQGRHAEALPHLKRALDILEAETPKGHPDRALVHLDLGNSLWAMAEIDEAREHFSNALRIWEQHHATDDPILAYALTGLGRTHLDGETPKEAVDLLERALELRDHDEEDALNVAETSLLLGRALWVERRDPQRALELAIVARDLVGADVPADAGGLKRLLSGADVPGLTDRLTPAGLGLIQRRLRL